MTFGNKKGFQSGAADDDEKFFVSSSKSPERASETRARGCEGRGGPGSLQSSDVQKCLSAAL